MERKIKAVEFIGYQETLAEPVALFNVTFEGEERGTTLAEPTLRRRGLAVPPHPEYTAWLESKSPLNGTIDIEAALARLNARLDMIARQIDQKKARMMELKPVLAKARTLKAEIGHLKQQQRSLAGKRDWLVAFFRELHGSFPDGMYPLFQQQHGAQAH
jgi:hypothetical protein